MPRRRKPRPVDFSDKAKRAAGIEPSDFGREMAREKREHQTRELVLRTRIEFLERQVAMALGAFAEGRRGDGMAALRKALPQPAAVPKGPPQDPKAA